MYSLSDDTWGEEEVAAIEDVVQSGNFTMGDRVRRYEADFARKFGSRYAVMVNSGSSANLLAVAALVYSGRLRPGDEVLVTAVSWSTTYFPLYQMGLKVRLVDIDLNTLNVDLLAVEDAITSSTRAIMAVNLLGNPNDFAVLENLCEKRSLILIEDNCESMGAELNGRCAGTFGVIGTFSTYYSHHLCTMEGGMCLTDDEELYSYMLAIRSHGWTRHLPDNSAIHKKRPDPFYESFNFIVPGFNLRPLEVEAAVGIEQLKKLDQIISVRRENAQAFKAQVSEKLDLTIQSETGSSSWFGFALILPERLSGRRGEFTNALRASGIEVRPIVAGNFARQAALQYMDYSIYGDLQRADYVHENGFFVGNHSARMARELVQLVGVLEDVCAKLHRS